MTWIDVLDTTVKIGLGAVIAAVSGAWTQKVQHSHDYNKRCEEQYYRRQEQRKAQYLEFCGKSYSLLHKYELSVCDIASEDYASYLTSLASVRLIVSKSMRESALEVVNSVIPCLIDSSTDLELTQSLRQNAKLNIAMFEEQAQEDVTANFEQKT